MNFVSYAQNFEDVMLYRALAHIDCGAYIDVGANDPEIDSVTKSFYDRGWRGINIEPVEQWFKQLQEKRPHDINLQVAAGAQKGKVLLYEIADTGLSSIDQATAEKHEIERGYNKIERIFPVETLTAICQNFQFDTIHFLKIDVEGAEKEVITGIDFSIIRPWIILVEATLPNSQEEDYTDWEPFILKSEYTYTYFDGLNRYYVANEHKGLISHFQVPPNVFDKFITRQQLNSELRAQQAEAKAQQAEAKAQQAEAKAQQAEAKAQQAEAKAQQAEAEAQQADAEAQQANAKAQQAEAKAQRAEAKAQQEEANAQLAAQVLAAVYESRSWRITAPLRWAGNAIRWFVRGSVAWLTFAPMSRPRRVVSVWLLHLKLYVSARPRFKAFVLRCLAPFPSMNARFRMLGRQTTHATHSFYRSDGTAAVEGVEQLTPQAHMIYKDLKTAMEQCRKG